MYQGDTSKSYQPTLSGMVCLVMLLFGSFSLQAAVGDITTVAGGRVGSGLQSNVANLNPKAIAVDSTGNLYIADRDNQRIRRMDGATGITTTVAGTGTQGFSGDGGTATTAQLKNPSSVVLDGAGNLYIADSGNQRIRRVDSATGIITTVVGNGAGGFSGDGGPAIIATLNFPEGVALDSADNLYIADTGNQRIRRVDSATGIITTVVGSGTAGFIGDGGSATAAQLSSPTGVSVDGADNLYIADSGNHRIRRVDGATGVIITVAGNGALGFSGDGGVSTAARLTNPSGVALDGSGNLYIADWGNNRIRRVDGATFIITTIAGNGVQAFSGDGGVSTAAQLNNPAGVVLDSAGNLYIADWGNSRIRRVDGTTDIITTVAGPGGDGGPATAAWLDQPLGVSVDSSGNLYIAENISIRRVDGATGVITTVAGNGTWGFSGDGGPATAAQLNGPVGVSVDGVGNLYIGDWGGDRIRRVDGATGIITTVAGNGVSGFSGDGGPATAAQLSGPEGLSVDGAGNLYIADRYNHRIRRVDGVTGIITTVAGSGPSDQLGGGFSGDGGPATAAKLNMPHDVVLDSAGNLYIADSVNNRTRRVDGATGMITTVAGNGVSGFSGDGGPATTAQLNFPISVSVDGVGNLFIADYDNQRIRRVDGATGIITTVVGNGMQGFGGDGGAATVAQLNFPFGLRMDGAGNLYIADSGNNRIRRVEGIASSYSLLLGLGNSSGSWLEQLKGTPPHNRTSWARLNWGGYNSSVGETRPVSCDVDGDGQDEVVVGLASGGDGWLEVLDDSETGYSHLAWLRINWVAYNTANGETFPACGDVDGDGKAEIVVGLGAGGGGWLKAFDDASAGFTPLAGTPRSDGWILLGWGAYQNTQGETHPAIGNLDGDAAAELVIGLGNGGKGWVRLLDDAASGFTALAGAPISGGWAKLQWGGYNSTTGAIRPAVCDLNGDGQGEVVLGLGSGGQGFLQVLDSSAGFNPLAGTPKSNGWLQVNWGAYNSAHGESFPSCGDMDGDGKDELAIGLGTGGQGFV